MIWTDTFLDQLSTDAEQEICKRIDCLYERECLQTTAGVSVYVLDKHIRSILSVAWLGRRLDAVSWEELQYLTPATAIVDEGTTPPYPAVGVEVSQSKPLYYALHPTNLLSDIPSTSLGAIAIRLYPCPNLSLSSSAENPYAGVYNGQSCVIGYWRNVDTSGGSIPVSPHPPSSSLSLGLLPSYVARRTQKAYVCWKAFEAEGPGQNATAAKYYQAKFEFLVERFKAINEGCYVSKRYEVDAGMLTIDKFRYPKPILPSNFERVIY